MKTLILISLIALYSCAGGWKSEDVKAYLAANDNNESILKFAK